MLFRIANLLKIVIQKAFLRVKNFKKFNSLLAPHFANTMLSAVFFIPIHLLFCHILQFLNLFFSSKVNSHHYFFYKKLCLIIGFQKYLDLPAFQFRSNFSDIDYESFYTILFDWLIYFQLNLYFSK